MIFVKLIKKVGNLKSRFSFTEFEKKMLNYDSVKVNESSSGKTIVVQATEDYFYFHLFKLVIKSIESKYTVNKFFYLSRALSIGRFNSLKSFFRDILTNNWLSDRKYTKLYESFSGKLVFRLDAKVGISIVLRHFFYALSDFRKITSKSSLIELKFKDLVVGDLIYDSYLRYKPSPTVHTNDLYLLYLIYKAYNIIHISDKYFANNTTDIFLTSYSTYIHHGIPVRVALNYGVSVYSFGSYISVYEKLSKENFYHQPKCSNCFERFEHMSDKEEKLKYAESGLISRMSGKIDSTTSFMKQSAYSFKNELSIDVSNAVIIFMHDFFDSPHIYGSMVFCDFYEWFMYTVNLLDANNIKFLIKPHPNQSSDSAIVLKELLDKNPNIKVVPSSITNKQLVEGGIILGVTVYGTVAHELTYLGVPVVSCAENPHSSYSFSYEAKTINEYASLLTNAKNLKIPENAKREIESFYFMHNLNHNENEIRLLQNLANLRKFDKFEVDIFDTFKELLDNIKNNIEFSNLILNIEELQDEKTRQCISIH